MTDDNTPPVPRTVVPVLRLPHRHPTPDEPDAVPATPPTEPSLIPAAAVMALTTHGMSLQLELLDVEGRLIWAAGADVGRSRLHAHPPQEILARTGVVQMYLSAGPQGDPGDLYIGHMDCGCAVRYAYRPGITGHCPHHGNQPVLAVDYPTRTAGTG